MLLSKPEPTHLMLLIWTLRSSIQKKRKLKHLHQLTSKKPKLKEINDDKEEEKEPKQDKPKKPSYPPPSPNLPESPRHKAPPPPSEGAEEDPQGSTTKSIDVLPLLHKGVRMNKFKMNGNTANVRLFFLSSDNQYFCWSPNLDNKNTFDVANLIKSDEERRILLESIKEVKRNTPANVQHLNFVPANRKSCTLTITYNSNFKPRTENQKGRSRSFTQGGSGLRAPFYKQVSVMAYEEFHFEMVASGLEKLMAISKDPKEQLDHIFELFVEFPKVILPKHLRPQKYRWEALKHGENENADEGPLTVQSEYDEEPPNTKRDRDRVTSF